MRFSVSLLKMARFLVVFSSFGIERGHGQILYFVNVRSDHTVRLFSTLTFLFYSILQIFYSILYVLFCILFYLAGQFSIMFYSVCFYIMCSILSCSLVYSSLSCFLFCKLYPEICEYFLTLLISTFYRLICAL